MIDNKTISILGSGWLGYPLAKFLSVNGFRIKLSSRTDDKLEKFTQDGFEAYKIDINNHTFNSDFFQTDCLIINITSKNINGFHTLVSQIAKNNIKKVLFISSTAVYMTNSRQITETSDIDLEHPLYKIETLFLKESTFNTTIIRFAGLIGPERHPGNFFRSGRKITSPNAPVNLIHRDDCVHIIYQVIKQNKWNKTYNACVDSHPSKKEFYTFASKLLGNNLPKFDESIQHSYKVISNKKLIQDLHYSIIHSDLFDPSIY